MTLAFAQVPIVLAAAVVAVWWLPSSVAAAARAARRGARPFRGDVSAADVSGGAHRPAGPGVRRTRAVWRLGLGNGRDGRARGPRVRTACPGRRLVRHSACCRRRRAMRDCSPISRRDAAAVGLRRRMSAKGYVARSLWVAVSQTAQVLLNGTDVMIIGALLGPAAVVPYACTGKLIARAGQPAASDPAERRARHWPNFVRSVIVRGSSR